MGIAESGSVGAVAAFELWDGRHIAVRNFDVARHMRDLVLVGVVVSVGFDLAPSPVSLFGSGMVDFCMELVVLVVEGMEMGVEQARRLEWVI